MINKYNPQISLPFRKKTSQHIYRKLPFKFIDLFAGIGGFRCGMTAIGGECVFSNEWDKYAAQSYSTWYHDSNISTKDIKTISIKEEIPDHDILCAGFPCQPFSLAGVSKKVSLGRSHGFSDKDQGNLFFRIVDIVNEKRPPIVFLENVKNLKSHDHGNTWKIIENSLADSGYVVYSKIIDARFWVPQHRERIFIVCFDRKIFGNKDDINFGFPDPPPKTPVLSEILEELPDKKYMLSNKLWQYLQDYKKKHKEKSNGFGYGLHTGEDVARTMSARYHKDGSEILLKQKRWKNPRKLTPFEAMGLLGFSKRYSKLFGHKNYFPQIVSDTQAYRQFGNSLVPQVVEAIGYEIVDCMATALKRINNGCLLKSH